MDKVSVILCTFKEKENIKLTLEKLLKFNIYEVIIIDDDSNDGIFDEIKKFNSDKIKFYQRKKTKGFASAFIYGLMKSNGNFILRFDADMHSSIEHFFNMIKENLNKELIIFSRYVKNGRDERDTYRRIPSLIINKICQILLSNKIKDYSSGILFFDKNILKDIVPKNTKYGNFIIEFVFNFILKKKNFIEVPFIQTKSTQENSKSAPNIFKFIYHGILYIMTIINCIILKIVK